MFVLPKLPLIIVASDELVQNGMILYERFQWHDRTIVPSIAVHIYSPRSTNTQPGDSGRKGSYLGSVFSILFGQISQYCMSGIVTFCASMCTAKHQMQSGSRSILQARLTRPKRAKNAVLGSNLWSPIALITWLKRNTSCPTSLSSHCGVVQL